MKIEKHDTAKEIKYFNLEEFIDKIKLDNKVLEHIKETNENFEKYFKQLSKYSDEFLLYFWISLAYEEIKNSNFVENHNLTNFDFSISDLFFDNLDVNSNRIHNIHKFVMRDEKPNNNIGNFRTNEVKVSSVHNNVEEIFWYGVKPQDIENFMNDFINIYNNNNSLIDQNPFLKSALVHLLFVKIHPYYDGNGRTARILHNIKFTEIINKLYNMDLRISPINLSESINLNIISYIKAFDNIYFDLEHDNNKYLNYWFNFILNSYDEQLFNKRALFEDIDIVMERIMIIKEKIDNNNIIMDKHIRIRK